MRKCLFFVLILQCSTGFAIINGVEVDKGYEAIGSLRSYDMDSGSRCTATLIAPDWIVTAEHCAEGGSEEMPERLKPSQIYFQTGTDSRTPIQSIKLKRWIAGPKIKINNEVVQLDISFAQLSKPITNISPIPLKIDPNQFTDKSTMYEVVGFGFEGTSGYGSPDGKKKMAHYKVTTTIGEPFSTIFKSIDNFRKYIANFFPEEDATIVMGDITPIPGYQVHSWDERERANGKFSLEPAGGWSNTCNGDSGGPMLEKTNTGLKIVGIISGGYTGVTMGCAPVGSIISVFGPAIVNQFKKTGLTNK